MDAAVKLESEAATVFWDQPRTTRKVSVVNGYIVYTRAKRSQNSCNGFSEDGEFKRFMENAELPVEMKNGMDCCVGRDSKGNELKSEFIEIAVRSSKRFRRSSLKANVDSGDNKAVTESEQVANGKSQDGINGALGGNRNKLEMKMSKKIVVNKKPVTVKELFDTGLLDGVSVVYMGGIKKASGLRGVIRDGGILCSCSLCNGCRVIPPSQFEIHACNQYRRAAQYICLENGKSLLDLLKACRGAPLHTLEATVQNFVGSPPEEKYFTCKRCKGCFPSSCVERLGPICSSCVESNKSEENSNGVAGKRVR